MFIVVISEIRTPRVTVHADSSNSRQVTLGLDSSTSDADMIPGKIALIIDVMGTGLKPDDRFNIVCYPIASFKMIANQLVQGKWRLNTEFVVFHLDTNLVMEFE